MSNQEESKENGQLAGTGAAQDTSAPVKAGKNWPLVRKMEALIFLAMFLAVPLFGLRVIQYTRAQLLVRTVYRELVHDLGRAKSIAMNRHQPVEVVGSAAPQSRYFSYAISTPDGVIEEIILPQNVTVVGRVTFLESGRPLSPSSFIVSSFNRTAVVEIDKGGIVSVP